MNNDKHSSRHIAGMFQAASILLLLLHVYVYYFPVFPMPGLASSVITGLLKNTLKTGLFDNAYTSKGLALLFLLLSIVASPVRRTPSISKKSNVWLLLVGVVIYLIFIPGLSNWDNVTRTSLILYSVSVIVSWLMILTGSTRLLRQLSLPWSKRDPFGRGQAGFPQEQQLISNAHSLHLQGRYTWKGKQQNSWINLVNPRRGVMIMGSPGSGKSWFIIEPFIRQLIEKGVAMFVYDHKYDALTRIAWTHFNANRNKYPMNTAFYVINFTDLSKSHRCNVLDPSTMNHLSDALDVSRTILLSINKTWSYRQGDFFVESPVNFVAALIWFLRCYQGGIYCTLPHVIELAKTPYDRLFPLLASNPRIATLVDPFVQAYNNKTLEMLDGQVAGAKVPLGRLSSPELYYVLTGNDFSLDINDPAAPKIFCLGGDPSRGDALAPVLSLYIDRLTRVCNRPGQYPCALVCDEFATVRAYNMVETIATGRSNNITPILAIQDASQLRIRYSHEEANTILNICGNLFCGQVAGDSARWASERFPKILQDRSSVSVNTADTSVSTTQQWEQTITPSTISSLSSGEFIGITADEPGAEQEFKTFHTKIIREDSKISYNQIPTIREVNEEIIVQQYNRVKSEVDQIVLDSLNYQINNSSSPNADFSETPPHKK